MGIPSYSTRDEGRAVAINGGINEPETDVANLDAGGRIKAIFSACAGNMVEWFDFFVYAYTAIYFAPVLFPAESQTAQLIASAAVFAVGFLMRPIGGWVFGRIADTQGRKIAMTISVTIMCAGSLMIAVVPSYTQIGLLAPIVLLGARLLQGLSVGAEYGTGATYLSEIATKGRRGFYGSLQYTTIIAGQLLALLTIIVLQQILSPAQLGEWGWRIPFLLGAAGAVTVFLLRRSMVETATPHSRSRAETGGLQGLARHRKAVTLVFFFTICGSLYFYTFTTYMQKFLVLSGGLDASTASMVMSLALILFMILQPLFGILSDRIGMRTHMRLFTGLATLAVVPILYGIQNSGSGPVAFALVALGLVIAAFYTPIAGLLKADMFPIEIRALGVGFPYAVGNALFGGTAEYVALNLRSMGMENAYFYYVALVCFVGFLFAVKMPDLRRRGYLDGDGRIDG
ncbi:MFS family transporter [Novosphingobium sp.]|jgi:MHS family alpha-ketoglutarate permease-like MFS transporter|uniref:MFS family transporter n=1 Tax=Novosphingobium sp. TaxID=1874826 RepID=UPI0028ABA8CE|nr:MFS family transporter [Novosphingobium sp.]